jgi:hypothetical protein
LSQAVGWNVENRCIDRMHFLQSPGDNEGRAWLAGDFEKIKKAVKVGGDKYDLRINHTTTRYEGRLLFSEAFSYANQNLKGHIVILANLDIYFDDSLCLLRSADADIGMFTAYFLSRYEKPETENTSIGTQCGPRFIGSHDSIVFIPPLPLPMIEKCNFEIGSWGIESRILWEMEQVIHM